jgi:hypothetical protein
MKRILSFSIAGILMAGMAIGAAAQAATSADANQSLGDVARAQKANKKPDTSKHFDNDTMPRTDKLSVVGPSSDSADANAAPAADGTQAASAATQPASQSATDKQQAANDMKDKIADAQSRVDLLTRELNVAQKEYQLRTASFYGDAGERLRNASAWDKEDVASKDTLAGKQKELDDAKQALADVQEEARKAGLNSSK